MNRTHCITHLNASRLALLTLGAAFLAACGSRVPARVETVNGHQVEIATAGERDGATVVFEAGLGEDWTHWDRVASEVALDARVFAYSRPGFGASDAPTTPRDPKQIVEELRTLDHLINLVLARQHARSIRMDIHTARAGGPVEEDAAMGAGEQTTPHRHAAEVVRLEARVSVVRVHIVDDRSSKDSGGDEQQSR